MKIPSENSQMGSSNCEWVEDEQQTTIALVAPKDCGKTAYLAALRHMSTQASHLVGSVGFRLGAITGYDPDHGIEEMAKEHIENVYQDMLDRERGEPTSGWFTYRTIAERLDGRIDERREIYLLDAKGGHLFPGLGVDEQDDGPDEERPTLLGRVEQLGLRDDAEHVLMAFVNEPTPVEGWRMHHQTPSALAAYLEGMSFNRVILYVACADVLFPRLGNLRGMLDRFNQDVEDPGALHRYIDHFRGSPHCDFTLDLVQYLANAGLIDSGTLSVFWGSSFGVERASGRPNIAKESGPSRLQDPLDWIPVQVVEPLLWGSGLLTK